MNGQEFVLLLVAMVFIFSIIRHRMGIPVRSMREMRGDPPAETGETLRLAEGCVQVKALGPVAVKGLADPVEVFELVGASSTRTRLQVLAARGLTRFVGRQAEIESLRQALERAGTSHGPGVLQRR